MRVPRDSPLARTWCFTQPERAETAIADLVNPFDLATLEALVELIYANPTARIVLHALRHLASVVSPIVDDALVACLKAPQATIRLEALTALTSRATPTVDAWALHLLRTDSSWPTRRAALLLLAQRPDPIRLSVLHAADDPHWRVRHALLDVLESWPALPKWNLDEWPPTVHYRVTGVAQCLAHRRGKPCELADAPLQEPERPPFFDWDPAVMAYKMERMNAEHRAAWIAHMPDLLAHDDDRVRRMALRTVREADSPEWWVACLMLLDDPRRGAMDDVHELFARLDLDDQQEVRAYLQTQAVLSTAQQHWLAQGIMYHPPEPPRPSWHVDHPHERAKRLTREQATALVANPTQETSWHVLTQACKLAKVPPWTIAPDVDSPLIVRDVIHPTVSASRGPLVRPRLLGPSKWPVTPLGVSGHYGLPVEGFVTALEVGVNLFFWEPNYTTLTSFSQRLQPAIRREIHFVAGTFEATAKGVRRDCERALKMLNLERLSLFLLFWTRSWDRLDHALRTEIEALQHEGKIETVSLSTHDRALAVQAMQNGWDPVMVRHSAAHRKAESLVFPDATTHRTSIITFNNTCYGRLLRPHGSTVPPSAADCYRYALEQPSVRACWTAPTTVEQLHANLQAILDPELPADRREALLAHGARVYAEDTYFTRWVRSR